MRKLGVALALISSQLLFMSATGISSRAFAAEPRYVWASSSALNGMATHAGIAFHVR